MSPNLLATYAPSVDRIIIAVRDLRVAVRFYTQVLGFEVTKFRRRAGFSSASAVLSAGPLRVVLVQGFNTESRYYQFVNEFGPGVHHLCVGVNDLPRQAEELKAAGMASVEWQQGEGRLVIPRDECSGTEFVFIERAGDGPSSGASLQDNVSRGPWR